MIDQLQINLERAKETYINALRGIDSRLNALVSQDPARIPDAEAVQAQYPVVYEPLALEAREQPVVEPPASAEGEGKPTQKRGWLGKKKGPEGQH